MLRLYPFGRVLNPCYVGEVDTTGEQLELPIYPEWVTEICKLPRNERLPALKARLLQLHDICR